MYVIVNQTVITVGYIKQSPVKVIAISRMKYKGNNRYRPAGPRTQHDYHHDTKVKPEAATVVIELLMMGGKTPETC
jgi:hypothetical protein